MVKNLLVFISLFFFILASFTCKSPTGPGDSSTPPPPGSRDYTWTVDTLNTSNFISSISGSSPTDIWAVGNGGLDDKQVWHFNGSKWEANTNLSTSPNCIFSISQDNAWIGGGEGKIFHYDGNNWSLSYTKPDRANIIYIWGKSSTDVYALGWKSILHYDGNRWEDEYNIDNNVEVLDLLEENSKVYIMGIKEYGSTQQDTIIFYQYTDKKLNEIYMQNMNKIIFGSINLIDNDVYFLIGNNLDRYINGKFVQIKTFNVTNFGYNVYGRNENDIFIDMLNGIAQYNGQDIQYLYTFKDSGLFIQNLIFNSDVFFSVYDFTTGTNIILHGVLKN
jgi:hypothetical protein